MDNQRLAVLVSHYRENQQTNLAKRLMYFRMEKSLRNAIRYACLGPDNKIEVHQYRVGRKILAQAEKRLARVEKEIQTCQSFDELHDLVEKATANVPRFGELAVYDTALRLGAHLKVLPKVVYLHAGTRKGCRSLGIVGEDGKVAMDRLPEPIRRLRPHEAEDFLCIYKDDFKNGKESATSCDPIPKRRQGPTC